MNIICFCMWVCFFVVTSMLFNGFSVGVHRSALIPGVVLAEGSVVTSDTITSGDLEAIGHHPSIDQKSDGSDVNLEDYRPYDPSPSSKASVKPGPIQHGTPLMPYIPNPKPSPPRNSNHDGSPSPAEVSP